MGQQNNIEMGTVMSCSNLANFHRKYFVEKYE